MLARVGKWCSNQSMVKQTTETGGGFFTDPSVHYPYFTIPKHYLNRVNILVETSKLDNDNKKLIILFFSHTSLNAILLH